MMNRKTRIACLASAFAGLMSFAAVADGNGSGNEPSDKKESAVTICTVAPWFCGIVDTQGNGSGNEPPKVG